MTLRVVMAEDEPLARRTLRRFLDRSESIELVGEAADGREAVDMIDRLKPDLLFLDVRMPELSGLEVLKRIRHRPAIVFTTAHDEYAVAAFEVEAIDYLLKPFGRKRFEAALERIRRRLSSPSDTPADGDRARAALSGETLTTLYARRHGSIMPIPTRTISHIEGADDYCAVHAEGETHLVALRLKHLMRRLDRRFFVRIHRSHIVNLEHVDSIRSIDHRRLEVALRDGRRVTASRSGSTRLRRATKNVPFPT